MVCRAKPYLYLLPAGLILLVFHVVSFLAVIWISFHKNWGTPENAFIGLANYRDIFHNGDFPRALGITVWYAVGTIPATIGLAFVFAVILQRKTRSGAWYRMIYFLPYITSTVAAAAVWKWIFHVDEKGLANWLLMSWGGSPLRFAEESRGIFEILFGHGLPGLGAGPSLALVTVMIFSIWQTFGFYVIIFSAGLGQIPSEVYEAASLDGAGPCRTFASITVPLMRPILGFLLVISTISAFQTFNQIYIMAPSERLNSAKNLTMYIVTQFWDFGRLGEASAAALLLFFLLAGLTGLQLWFSRRKD
jgi:multiple sugar transport system permease protein